MVQDPFGLGKLGRSRLGARDCPGRLLADISVHMTYCSRSLLNAQTKLSLGECNIILLPHKHKCQASKYSPTQNLKCFTNSKFQKFLLGVRCITLVFRRLPVPVSTLSCSLRRLRKCISVWVRYAVREDFHPARFFYVIQLSRNKTFNKSRANLSVNNFNSEPVIVYGFTHFSNSWDICILYDCRIPCNMGCNNTTRAWNKTNSFF
jgi:hypothetical protein